MNVTLPPEYKHKNLKLVCLSTPALLSASTVFSTVQWCEKQTLAVAKPKQLTFICSMGMLRSGGGKGLSSLLLSSSCLSWCWWPGDKHTSLKICLSHPPMAVFEDVLLLFLSNMHHNSSGKPIAFKCLVLQWIHSECCTQSQHQFLFKECRINTFALFLLAVAVVACMHLGGWPQQQKWVNNTFGNVQCSRKEGQKINWWHCCAIDVPFAKHNVNGPLNCSLCVGQQVSVICLFDKNHQTDGQRTELLNTVWI